MTAIEIRQVSGEAIWDTALYLTRYAFGATPSTETDEMKERMIRLSADRYYVVLFEDNQPMATANVIPMTQNVRGKIYAMGGVAGVATHPSARRKGYAKQLLMNTFEKMRADGQPFSTLYPFRESFYGRLGYINFPLRRFLKINPLTLAPFIQKDLAGRVEMMEMKDGFEIYRQFLSELQPQLHGMSMFPLLADSWRKESNQSWVVLAYDDQNQVIGVMTYALKGYREDANIGVFLYRNALGKYLLLQWLARHGDQVRNYILRTKPDDLIETWAYDIDVQPQPAFAVDGIRINPQGRIMRVDKIGGMQTGEGAVTVRITDRYGDWNNGTYHFETVNGVLQVERTQAPPQAELTIEGLAALVYNGQSPADFEFYGWGNPSVEAQTSLQRMFPPAYPYVLQDF